MAHNTATIVAIELLAAAQGIDFRRPLRSSDPLEDAHHIIRCVAPRLEGDRYLALSVERRTSGSSNARLRASSSSCRSCAIDE